jgi:FKBP-type peptidyl-prolyl cis-trans isomerase SlyD
MVVSVAFRLYDAAGDLLDEVTAAEPLTYVHGYAQLLRGLEAGLEGAAVGEARSIVVLPEEAFGEHDPDARLEIDPDDFPGAADARVGDEIVATGPDGVEAVHRILDVDEDAIVVDLNHPLAGEVLRFEVTICDVRPASDEDLERARQEAERNAKAAGQNLAIAHAERLVYGSESDSAAKRPIPSLVQLRLPDKRTEENDE